MTNKKTSVYALITRQERQLAGMDVAEGQTSYGKTGLKPIRVRFKKWHTSLARARVRAAFRLLVFWN